MIIGYARVSTEDQDTDLQASALRLAGCNKLYTDKASGGRSDRPALNKALEHLRPGDVFLVWKLDRLSRSLKDLLFLIEQIEALGASFKSLTEQIDTASPAGRMMMQMVGAFAEFERAMVKERTKAGLATARLQGRIGGRPRKLTPHQEADAINMVQSGGKTPADVARTLGVHRSTIGRLLQSQSSIMP
jgi:DNA invertase Pin-like site-specific DNA recombinase